MARISELFRPFWIFAALFCLLGQPVAQASILDTPRFKIDGVVIVWGVSDGATGAARIGDKLRVMPAAQTSPADNLVPVTGILEPLGMDDLTALADTQMHFHVASNTAFSMDAELVGAGGLSDAQLRATNFQLRAHLGHSAEFGRSAQFPHQAGALGGIAPDVRTLADLTRRRRVFTGNQPTAAKAGSIVDQSVRFDLSLEAGGPVSDITAPDIVFTIFVP